MGTRCLTIVVEDDKEIANIYRHFDGYPDSHGVDLLNYLKDQPVVNGYTLDMDKSLVINGMTRVAPKIISKLELDGHDPRLLPIGSREVGEEYIYLISLYDDGKDRSGFITPPGKLELTIYEGPITLFGEGGEDCNNIIYKGLLDDFDPNKITDK